MDEASKLLGESYGFWVQTGAIILSIIVTGFYARKAILSNGSSAKETLEHNQRMQQTRATIDLILQENQDVELNQAKQTISKLPENASFLEYLDVREEDSDEKKQIKQSIRVLMNRYEFIALGIKNEAFEESIYKELQFSDVTDVWKKSKPLIMELRRRKGKNTYYQEFEWLTDRWLNNPLVAYKNS
ncbi:DUF4760 domain-containing protein [Actinobacillus equuli subsp. equuli]|uniref:DUF4760 domain-containing protein n=1 Tax=Actinobacillus equuli subsp. equuli TaxID=202947 RepID=A0A9X4G875_ACTEU|nr:DUF4760 domain-containing protein [Actinobacillus equuli]MDE8035780.1 DUF4760 domain-containing protein [Actinobacillus equuli subsp. equuli]